MTSPTMSYLVREWTGEPEEGRSADEWPFPTEYRMLAITGELADRIRARFDAAETDGVTITEESISGGYSEYTQETEMNFTVTCGSRSVSFDEYAPHMAYGSTTVARLQAWLEASS
jgi:hypothetical protein